MTVASSIKSSSWLIIIIHACKKFQKEMMGQSFQRWCPEGWEGQTHLNTPLTASGGCGSRVVPTRPNGTLCHGWPEYQSRFSDWLPWHDGQGSVPSWSVPHLGNWCLSPVLLAIPICFNCTCIMDWHKWRLQGMHFLINFLPEALPAIAMFLHPQESSWLLSEAKRFSSALLREFAWIIQVARSACDGSVLPRCLCIQMKNQ